jgi:hypothetical protein
MVLNSQYCKARSLFYYEPFIAYITGILVSLYCIRTEHFLNGLTVHCTCTTMISLFFEQSIAMRFIPSDIVSCICKNISAIFLIKVIQEASWCLIMVLYAPPPQMAPNPATKACDNQGSPPSLSLTSGPIQF